MYADALNRAWKPVVTLFLAIFFAAPGGGPPPDLAIVDAWGNPVAEVGLSSRLFIRIEDAAANPAGSFDQVTASVSSGAGDSETVECFEQAAGHFLGKLPLDEISGSQSFDGRLQILAGQSASVTYLPAGGGDPLLVQATAVEATLSLVDDNGVPVATVVDGDFLRVRLEGDEGIDGLLPETLSVVATRSGTTDEETFLLTETGPDTGVFLGSLPLARAGQDGAGVLDWSPAPASITVTYTGPYLTLSATAEVVGARVEVLDPRGEATDRLGPQDGLRLRVFDPFNDNPSSLIEYRTVTVTESPGGDTETLSVWEVAPAVFESQTTFPFGAGASGNGLLAVVPGSSQLVATFTPSVGTAVTADASVLDATLRFLNENGEGVDSYLLGEWIEVELRYPAGNTNGNIDQVSILLSSVIASDVEALQLTEISSSSGVFRGRMRSRFSGYPSNDSELSVYVTDSPGWQFELGRQFDSVTASLDLGGGSFFTHTAPFRGGAEIELLDAAGEPTEVFAVGEEVWVRLYNYTEDLPGLETRYVSFECPGSGDYESLILTETGGTSSTFEGRLRLSAGPVSSWNGQLECPAGSEVVVNYVTGTSFGFRAEDRARVNDATIAFVDTSGSAVDEVLKGTLVRVRVHSEAANADSHDFDTLSVTVASRNTLDSAVLELREISLDSGIFEGEVRIIGSMTGGAYEDVEVAHGPPPLSLADVLVASVPGAEAEAAVLEGRLRVTDLAGNELSYLLHKGEVRVQLEMPGIGYPGLQITEVQILTSAYEGDTLTLWETSPDSNVFVNQLLLDPNLTYPNYPGDATISPYVGSSVEFKHVAGNLTLLLPVSSVEVYFEDAAGARLESAPYGVPLWVEVTKATNLLNPSQVETLEVVVNTDRLGDEELVTLTETTASSGIFRASLPVNASTGRIPGNLAIDADAGAVDTIRARVVGVEGVAASVPTRQAQVRFLNAQGQETDVLVLGQVATIEIVDPLQSPSFSVELKSNGSYVFGGYVMPTYPGSPIYRISFLPYNGAGAPPASSLMTVALSPGQVVSVTHNFLYSYGASTVATATAEDRRLEILGEDGEDLLELLEGESLKIRLMSSSQQSGVFESRTVTAGSQLSGDIETVQLWETSASSGIFERVLPTRFYSYADTTNQPNNGVLGLGTENPSAPHTGERIVVRHGAMYESPIEKTVPAIVPGRLEVFDGEAPAVAVLPDYTSRTLRLVRPTLPNGSMVTFEVQSGYYGSDFETFSAISLGNGVFEAQIPFHPIGSYGSYSGNGYVETTPGSEIFFRYQLIGYHTGQLEVVLPVASASMSFVDVTTGEVLAEAPDARPFKLRIQDEQNLTAGIDFRSVTLTTQLGDSETFSVPEINNWEGIFELVVTPRVRDVATPNNAQLDVGRTSVLVVAPVYDRVTATLDSPAIVASLPLTGPKLAFTNAEGEAISSIVTGALAYLRVDDNSVNFDPNLAETIQVEVDSLQDSYQTATLVETGPATGIFTGSIPIVQGAPVYNNGQIETYGGEMVRLHHTAFYYFQITTEVLVRASRLVFLAGPGGAPVEKYLEGENVYVRMEYAAGNTSPTVAEQVNVELRSIYWGDDVESLVLTETAPSSGIFEGGMATSLDPSISGDGTLQLGRGSSLDTALVSFGDDSTTADFEAARLRLLNILGQPITQLVPGQKLVVEVSKFAGTDPGQVDTLVGQTELVGLGGYDRESLTLVETGVDTHVLRGTMTTDTFGYNSWNGTLTFWYSEQVQVTFTDGPVSVVATVNGFYNQAPVVDADHISLTLGSSGNLDVLSDDFDPEGGALTLVALRPGPTSPDVSGVIEPNGTVTVTIPPDANLYGMDYQEMIYTVVDPAGLFTEGYIFVTGLAPPTVTITSPADGSVFAAGLGSEIYFEALVTDPDQPDICSGMIAAAVWESDIQPIAFNGCALNLPVSYFQVGTHVFTVTVTDFNNNVVTDTVTITIDGPPVLTMTSPAPGTTLQGGGITLTASAIDGEDGDLGASILWLSNVQGELGTGASLPVVLTPGSHNISARVTDSAGNDVRLDRWVEVNAQPVITIDSPIEGARIVGVPEVIASVTASDLEPGALTFEWWIDGNLNGTSTTTTRAFVDLAPGPHSLMVKAIDIQGGEATDTVSFTVIEAPTVTITAPTQYSVFVLGQSISFTATATDFEDGNIAAEIVWTSNVDGPIGTGGTFSVATLSRNSHTITATVEDADGLVDTATLILEVQTAPTVTISYPGEGESFPEGAQVSLGGAASDFEEGDISNEIVWTSSRDGALGTGAAFSVFSLTAGQHVITATITDNQGASANDTVTILINTPPTVTITAPAGGSSFIQGSTVNFLGSASDPENGNLTASITWTSSLDGAIGSGGAPSTSALSVGTHLITASVVDSNGAPANASVSITILANTAPAVTISSPTNGVWVAVGDNVTFTGSALDAQSGTLSASLVWTSSLNGTIGNGASFSTTALAVGSHTITAAVTDSQGLVGSAVVTVEVKVVSTTTFISVAAQDGFVLESGENTNAGGTVSTNSPRLGDNNADRQYRSFLSFDTSTLPDNAVIRNVTVRAQRSGTTGTNPATTHGTLQVDVKTGFFGTTVSLEAADFQSAATVDNACSMTPATANGQWSEGTLNAAGRSAVSLTSSTQLRLRFSLDDDDDGKNDFFDHYGGESTVATTRPQLVVEYLQ